MMDSRQEIRLMSIDMLNSLDVDRQCRIKDWLFAAWGIDEKETDSVFGSGEKPDSQFMNGCLVLVEGLDSYGETFREVLTLWWEENTAKARATFFSDVKTYMAFGAEFVFFDDPLQQWIVDNVPI